MFRQGGVQAGALGDFYRPPAFLRFLHHQLDLGFHAAGVDLGSGFLGGVGDIHAGHAEALPIRFQDRQGNGLMEAPGAAAAGVQKQGMTSPGFRVLGEWPQITRSNALTSLYTSFFL